MKTFRFVSAALLAVLICANFTSCSSNNNKTQEGQKALDAAVKREVNAANIQNSYLESREYYKRQGDQKNADYYDKLVKEQSKEMRRLSNETEKIREETYGKVMK